MTFRPPASILALFIAFLLALSGRLAQAQCPAVNDDTTCGTIITITNTGSSVAFTGQGPYDGNDDTLVGVVNNSKIPVTSIGLTSASDIFGFDGDGIDSYGIPGNGTDTTGYGGPNAYFSGINSSLTSGIVHFITPIAPNGGTGYFSLENALGTSTACTDIINNSVPKPPGGGTYITASFTPNYGYSLAEAAQICGFKAFDWIQTITHLPNPSPFCENNTATTVPNPSPFCGKSVSDPAPYPIHLTASSTPFNDAPPNGYTYGFYNAYPFYYPSGSLPSTCAELSGGTCVLPVINASGTVENFFDSPADPCFPGGSAVHTQLCGYSTVPAAQAFVAFTTHIGGVNADGTAKDLGIGFTWMDTFNGGSAGSISTGTNVPVNPAGGTGGVTVISSNETTNYTYPAGVAVTSINGSPVAAPTQTMLTGAQVAITLSGLAYSRVNQTFNGTITLTNVSGAAIAGPIQVVLSSITPTVTVVNASGTFGGYPYITLTSGLAPGASATVPVVLRNPSNAVVNLTPITYIGSFD